MTAKFWPLLSVYSLLTGRDRVTCDMTRDFGFSGLIQKNHPNLAAFYDKRGLRGFREMVLFDMMLMFLIYL